MRKLYTAFKGSHNTSFQLVNQINGDKLFLTNSFQGLEKDILSLRTDYDAIYMFGIDKNLKNSIRIETCANYNGELVSTFFDILSLEQVIKDSGITYTVSNKPTAYLCNAAYYHMLKKNRNTVFIHTPSIKGMNNVLMNQLLKLFEQASFLSTRARMKQPSRVAFFILEASLSLCIAPPREWRVRMRD